MRRQMIVVAIAVVAGFGVKQLFFSPSTALPSVDIVKGFGIDVSKMQAGADVPAQRIDDMTFVSAGAD
jgi:hypothetical protein